MTFTESEIRNFKPDDSFIFEEEEPKETLDLSNCLLIENIPQATKEKLGKLEQVLKKILSLKGTKTIKNFLISTNEAGTSTGSCFAEYEDAASAKEVQDKVDNFEIDKKMKLNLKITFLKDLEVQELKEYKEEVFQEPVELHSWLFDKQARDQYAIRYYEQTEICWNDEIQKSVSVLKKNVKKENNLTHKNWTLNMINWSPKGSYIATWHEQGIAIWGGDNFEKQAAFSHVNAKLIQFSPSENFIVTWNEDEKKNVVVWDIKTKKVRKVFSIGISPSEIMNHWPIFKWSHDDKFFSKMGTDQIEFEFILF
jgi:translation initiation factor 3 subunit B